MSNTGLFLLPGTSVQAEIIVRGISRNGTATIIQQRNPQDMDATEEILQQHVIKTSP